MLGMGLALLFFILIIALLVRLLWLNREKLITENRDKIEALAAKEALEALLKKTEERVKEYEKLKKKLVDSGNLDDTNKLLDDIEALR